ncbi:hypothetical protein P7C70_g855, partial [Phenoliferia sp. Uapishka_3]
MEDDSPWMNDDSGPTVSDQEWSKLSTRYSDEGYRDGITTGKQARLQHGFDQGFNQTSPFARKIGSLRGLASSLLAILTTSSGAKHATELLQTLGENKAEIVAECRAVVSALGKLDAERVLPVDVEAEAHAKSHADEGMSLEMVEKREMRAMEEAMNKMGGGSTGPESTLEECAARLEKLLEVCGIQGLLPLMA